MAAPVLSLGTSVFDVSAAGTGDINTDAPNLQVSYLSSQTRLRVQADVAAATEYFFELLFASAQDLTNHIFNVFAKTNETPTNFQVGLRSGAGNYRMWTSPYKSSAALSDVHIRVDQGAYTDTGTFDITAVDAVRFVGEWPSPEANEDVLWLYRDIYVYDADVGNTYVGGDGTTPSSVADLISQIENSGGLPVLTYSIEQGFAEIISLQRNLTLGDGVTADQLNFVDSVFSWADDSEGGPNGILKLTGKNRLGVATFSTLIRRLTAIGSKSEKLDFIDDGTRARNYQNLKVTNYDTVHFGQSDALGTIADGVGSITGGGALDLFVEGTAATVVFTWDGAATLIGTIDCPGSDFYIDIPNTVANGSTFDASGITFTNPPTTTHFRTNVPGGETITISVAAGSGLTLTDVTELGAGTTVVSAPQTTLTFTGIPSGTNGIIKQGVKIIAAEINITSGNFSYQYNHTPGELVSYEFSNPGLVTIAESLELPSVNQSIPLIFEPSDSYI